MLETANLVNYFGRAEDPDNVEVPHIFEDPYHCIPLENTQYKLFSRVLSALPNLSQEGKEKH